MRIKDTGAGISAEKLPYVFEMFFQVERSMSRAEGGSGIGLALVRRLVEMHGGTVEAYSQGANQGSEFVLRLPVLPALAAQPLVPKRDAIAAPGGPKRRILVVDDNRDSANTLSMMLRRLGHEVHTAYDGLEAVERAGEVRPEVVLLDIGMPGMDGYAVAERMRQNSWGKDPLIVALTGWGQDEDRERSRRAGFDRHLVKPVSIDSLTQLLAQPALRPVPSSGAAAH